MLSQPGSDALRNEVSVPSGLRSSAPDPLIGQIIAQRFLILALLGRGGFGMVYHARQISMNRDVALKVIKPQETPEQQEEFNRRFKKEVFLAAKLTSQHSVTIFDFGRDPELGLFFCAMELLTGPTLAQLLRRSGPLQPLRVVTILEQICDSLAEAHGRGIVHRDLKPDNIMFTPSSCGGELVKVLDFGIAKAVNDFDGRSTETGLVVGTPVYMSPEQACSEPLDGRSDLYSLGILAYELLSGQPPFTGNKISVLYRQVHEAPRPLVGFPSALTAVVDRLLAKRRDDRYRSAQELVQALAEVRVLLKAQACSTTATALQAASPGGDGPEGPPMATPDPATSPVVAASPGRPCGACSRRCTWPGSASGW